MPPPLLKAVTLPEGISATTLSSNCGDEPPFADFSPAEDQKCAHLAIMRIFRLAKELPLSIPLGTVDDQWAGFTGDISSDMSQYDDDIFMLVNHSLHRVFDYQMTAEELSNSIRRGPLGVEAFCNWSLKCMAEFKLSGGILEPRLDLLEHALKNICRIKPIEPLTPPALLPEPATGLIVGRPTDITLEIEVLDFDPAINDPIVIDPLPLEPQKRPCPGFKLVDPNGGSPYASYPFLVHTKHPLPWNVHITGQNLILYSLSCSGFSRSNPGPDLRPCSYCAHLTNHDVIMGIRHRNLDGAHENTPFAYLTPSHMLASLQRKTKENNRLKLRALKLSIKISRRNKHLDAWKRLAISIGTEDIPRIRSLMAIEHKRGRSVFSMLEKIDRAAQRAYRPLGYQRADFERAFLILKLGGRSAARIAQYSLGTPSIDATKRHIVTVPLKSSPAVPTMSELKENLALCYPPAKNTSDGVILGMTIQVDEIKLQERLRWDSRSNMILGVCREHGHHCVLDFRTIAQAEDIQDMLIKKKVHLATEATVIAASILSSNSTEYSARPFVISGSCKRESVEAQTTLLQTSITALTASQMDSNRRLYCVASDGDSRRRRALISIALCRELPATSKIYPLLAPLRLFNFFCGDDDLTSDFDTKHVLKRFRNTLLRMRGFLLDGTAISVSVLKAHLLKDGHDSVAIDALLKPNDKQDVVLMIKLLYAISRLPECHADDSPATHSTRRVLRLLGRLYFQLLQPYLNTTLSLNEQLSHLSAAAHLILALYNKDKGEFIPVQLYFDVMSMIKNVYFCVAKAQVDNPNGSFWIVLLGTDGLEKVFGMVRTMVGNDSHADQLQLTNRIDGAVQCTKILEEHPEWGGGSRRLKATPLPTSPEDVTSHHDHINPASMSGDLEVNSVVLQTCWQRGRMVAERELEAARIAIPFESMERSGGFNILSPFGNNKMVLVDGLSAGEREETTEEGGDSEPLTPSSFEGDTLPGVEDAPGDSYEANPDFDDISGEVEMSQSERSVKNTAWVCIGGRDDSKKVHKASILRIFSSGLSVSDSKDRLKRVRGYSQYDDIFENQGTPQDPDNPNEISVEDPALILVRSSGAVFLCVFQILSIRVDTSYVQSLSINLLHEPNIQFQGQVMTLKPCDNSHQPDGSAP
ncbi:hypothetical protein H0H93_007260 [Arthromyces matolae]|nr:hypothetical protein H0H93_007260 [Arthromyces matolae]